MDVSLEDRQENIFGNIDPAVKRERWEHLIFLIKIPLCLVQELSL